MLSREEATWLHRCIIGRNANSEDFISWMVATFRDFEHARTFLLWSEEFQASHGRLFIPNTCGGSNHAAYDDCLSRLRLARKATGRDVPEPLLVRSALDPLLRHLSIRFRVQIAIVIGGDAEMDHAARILCECGVFPALIIKAPSHTEHPDNLQAWLSRPNNLPEHVSVAEYNLGPQAFFDLFENSGAKADLVIVNNSFMNSDVMFWSCRSLNFAGLALFDMNTNREDRVTNLLVCAAALKIDPIMFGDFGILQSSIWVTPMLYREEPASCSSGRNKRLALATIVKDEERRIKTMLESVLPLVDFAVILDTGSNDRTFEIAQDALSQHAIPHLLERARFTNFSEMRNLALDKVPDDIDWVLMLDGDEHLVASDILKLFLLLDDPDVDIWMLPRYNFYDDGKIEEPLMYPDRQRRLIRNRPGNRIRFDGAVHEVPAGQNRMGVAPANMTYFGGSSGGPHIHHMGWMTPERWKEKTAFYVELNQR